MLGLDPRAARIAWTIGLVFLLAYVVFLIRRSLLILVLALFFAYLVYPLVRFLERRRLPRPIAAVAAFTIIGTLVAIAAALIGPPLSDQASGFVQQLPGVLNNPAIIERLPLPSWLESSRAGIVGFLRDQLQTSATYAIPVARSFAGEALEIAGNLVFVILIPILAFFLIVDGPSMREAFLRWTGQGSQGPLWASIVEDLDRLLGRYIRSLLLLSMAAFVAYASFFTATGVPYGLLLAGVAGLLEFIPVAGPLIAALFCLVVAAVSGYAHLLWIAVFIACYRGVQDYVLSPYLMSGGAGISPMLVILALLAGEQLAGVAGMFLAVPAVAAATIVARHAGYGKLRQPVEGCEQPHGK